MGPLIGGLWGAFVELDDGGSSATAGKAKPGSAKSTKTPSK